MLEGATNIAAATIHDESVLKEVYILKVYIKQIYLQFCTLR